MDLLLQLLVQGLASGALYAILGLSFGLIFNTTRVFHFAHGAVIGLGRLPTVGLGIGRKTQRHGLDVSLLSG